MLTSVAFAHPSPVNILLDVGISDVVTAAANFIERLYPYPDQITAAALDEAPNFKTAFQREGPYDMDRLTSVRMA